MTNPALPRPAPPRTKRPFSVTLLAIGVLIWSGLYLTRFFSALTRQADLADLLMPGSLVYLIISGALGAAVLLLLALGLWFGVRLARPAAVPGLAGIILSLWLERLSLLLINQSPLQDWLFWLALSLLGLALAAWMLARPAARRFFEPPA